MLIPIFYVQYSVTIKESSDDISRCQMKRHRQLVQVSKTK